MPNCIIYTFTGTGNSLQIATFLSQNLAKKGIETKIFVIKAPIDYSLVPDPNDYDYVGFTYPIYGFNAPKPLINFIKKLPKAKNRGKKYFIAKQSGEPFFVNNSSSHLMSKILKKKGYSLDLEHHFLMGYNIMFKYPKEVLKEMYIYSEKLCQVYADEIVDNHGIFTVKHGFFVYLLSIIIRLVWIAGPVNSKLSHVNKKKCIKCYKCIQNCPTNALYLNKKGEIKIHASCCICMKCCFSCPTDSFFMGFLNPWRINYPQGFQYKKLVADESINGDYIQADTKGYFKKFNKYFRKMDKIIENHQQN